MTPPHEDSSAKGPAAQGSAPAGAPDLSIILINWRMGRDVAGVLPSIAGHRHRCTVETVLVNKPSGDGTEELVAAEHPWVRLVTHDVFGIAEMRNVGIRHAAGRHFLILDADTELLPGCLDALVRFMDRHPAFAGCGGHTTRLDGSMEYNVKRFYDLPTVLVRRSPLQRLWPENPWSRRHLMKDKDHARAFEGDWMAGACFCIRREAVEQIGLFDDRYYFGFEDVDWCWRAKRAGWRIAFNPKARIIHKVQRLSDRGFNKMAWEHLKSGLRFWWKVRHQGLNWAWPSRPVPRRRTTAADAAAQADGPDISVVIVNYHGKAVLRDCLESLPGAAPARRMESIVVDNASTDGSVEMVRREFPGTHLIPCTTNTGFTRGNNTGIKEASGRYVILLNNDTRVCPGAFDAAAAYLDEHPNIGIAGLQLLNEDGTRQLSCRRFPSFSQALFNRYSLLTTLFPSNRFSRSYLMSDLEHQEVQDVDWVSGACLVIRRGLLDAIGPLDERFFMFSEDVDYCYRAWEAGYRVTYLPFAKVYHLIGHSSGKARAMTIVERHKSMYKFYKKHYSRSLMFLDLITISMVTMRCALQLGAAALPRRSAA